MGIRLGIGAVKLGQNRMSWTPHNQLGGESVNLWAKGRSGFTMTDTIGSNNITIQTSTYRCLASKAVYGTLGAIERVFDGGSYTIYFKFKRLGTVVGVQRLMTGGNYGADTGRGFLIWTIGEALYFDTGDGTNHTENVVVANMATTLGSSDWFEFFIEVDKANNRLRTSIFNQSTGAAVGTNLNIDISGFTFNNNNNAYRFGIENLMFASADWKKFNSLKTIAQCRDNTYLTDCQFYYPTIYDGTDVSGNGNHLAVNAITKESRYFSNVSTYCLDYGYSHYKSINKWRFLGLYTVEDLYIPNTPAGVTISRTINDGNSDPYVKTDDHAGNLIQHNLAESRLNIPIASWDKSSTTIFNDRLRASAFYDATNTDEWHIEELDYLLFIQNCKISHKGTNFFKIIDNSLCSRKILAEIFSFNSDKSTVDVNKILNYTGDGIAVNATMQFSYDGSVGSVMDIYVTGKTGYPMVQLYWGDGTKKEVITMDDTSQLIQRYNGYTGSEVFHLYMCNPASISTFLYTRGEYTTLDFAPLNHDIMEFNKAINLLSLDYRVNSVNSIGNINGLNKAITTLNLIAFEGTGNIGLFNALTHLGQCGNVSGTMTAPNLVCVSITVTPAIGDPDITFDITGLAHIESIDIQYITKFKLMGSVTGLATLKQICIGLPLLTTLSGNLGTCTSLEYWHLSGLGVTCDGDITGLNKLWTFRNQTNSTTFTGSIAGWAALERFADTDTLTNMTKAVRMNAFTKIFEFIQDTWIWSSAEVNAMLADLWANRNVARRYTTPRFIYLNNGASGAPTGQGITDKAALQAYHTPNDDPANDVWSIYTN